MTVPNYLSTKKAKLDFIRAISTQDITHASDFVPIVRRFVEDGDLKVNEINPMLLFPVIADAPATTRVTIGRRTILSLDYDRKIVTEVLAAMGGEYRRFITDIVTSTITYSMDAIKICNALVAKGYIESCEKNNNKIIIHKRPHVL